MNCTPRKHQPTECVRRRPHDGKGAAWKEPRLAADSLITKPASRYRLYVTKDGKPNYDSRYSTSFRNRKREQPARVKPTARSPQPRERGDMAVSLHEHGNGRCRLQRWLPVGKSDNRERLT